MKRGRLGTPLKGLIPPNVCTYPNEGPEFPTSYLSRGEG
jgi:hypothetical protein